MWYWGKPGLGGAKCQDVVWDAAQGIVDDMRRRRKHVGSRMYGFDREWYDED